LYINELYTISQINAIYFLHIVDIKKDPEAFILICLIFNFHYLGVKLGMAVEHSFVGRRKMRPTWARCPVFTRN